MSDKDLKMEEDEYKRLCDWSVKDSENDRKIKEEAAQVELADLLEMDQKPSSKAALDTTTSSSKTDKKDKKKDPNCLANKIQEGKKVLADSGLKGSEKASTRMPGNSHKMKHFRSRAQGRQESLFKRFKDFGILRQRFRYGYELHKMVLLAVAVIVQYDMENGHPLFDV